MIHTAHRVRSIQHTGYDPYSTQGMTHTAHRVCAIQHTGQFWFSACTSQTWQFVKTCLSFMHPWASHWYLHALWNMVATATHVTPHQKTIPSFHVWMLVRGRQWPNVQEHSVSLAIYKPMRFNATGRRHGSNSIKQKWTTHNIMRLPHTDLLQYLYPALWLAASREWIPRPHPPFSGHMEGNPTVGVVRKLVDRKMVGCQELEEKQSLRVS